MSPRLAAWARAIGLLALFPALSYVAEFACGFFVLSPYVGVLLLPGCILGALWASVIAANAATRGQGKPQRAGLVIAAAAASTMLCVWPARAAVYTDGLAAALLLRTDVDRVQAWSIYAVARFKAGTLTLEPPEHPYESVLSVRRADLPLFLRTGMFAGLPTRTGGTHVSIATHGEPEPYVVISWYLHGVAIGSPRFRSAGAAWYERRVRPGVYVYCVTR